MAYCKKCGKQFHNHGYESYKPCECKEPEETIMTLKKDEMGTSYLMQFFTYGHLPENLQAVSKDFADLAQKIDSSLTSNPEKSTALRKLSGL